MSHEEYKEKFPRFCQFVEGIHNEEQLAQLMAKEQAFRDPFDQVQFKTIFIPNYTKTESVFLFKCHHCFGDGLALISLILNL